MTAGMTFNGKNTDTYGMILLDEDNLKFSSVERDIQNLEIPGRDGSVLIDNRRFKTLDFEMPFRMRLIKSSFESIEKQMTAVKTWLARSYGFSSFTWAGEPEYIYLAQIKGAATFTRLNFFEVDVSVPLTLQPYKYFASSYNTSISLTSGQSVTNLGTQPAKPIFTLTGTGSVTLTVGSQRFILQNVTGGVVIDCEKQVVTDLTKTISRMEWVYSYPFPVLPTGSTVISWNNSAFTATIIERWCDLA